MFSVSRKLVVTGDGMCGKTSLLIAFSKDEYLEEYTPTVFDNYRADIFVEGQLMELSLWDTAGQEAYDRLRPLSYIDTDVVLVCFSVDSTDSFENVSLKWVPEVQHFCPKAPIVLVCNKIDLRNDLKLIEKLLVMKKRLVETAEGNELAQKVNAFAYLECSAATREGVFDVFEAAAKATIVTDTKTKKRRKCVIL